MKDSINPDLSIHAFPSVYLCRNIVIESVCDFRKQDIERAFVEVDDQLKQLALTKNLDRIRREVPNIRSKLFELYNLCVHQLDIKSFASREPGVNKKKKTPLNPRECAD